MSEITKETEVVGTDEKFDIDENTYTDEHVNIHDVVKDEQPVEDEPNQSDEELDKLEPLNAPRTWVIGKPPEHGGKESTYSVYVQDRLGYMPRMRFFALVSKTIVQSMKSSNSLDIPGLDMRDGLSMRERADLISAGSFESAGDFFKLALELVSQSPDFLLQCYCLWLNVPRKEVSWAMQVMEQPWDPDRDHWGLKDEDGLEMVEIFIDQNYEDIRRFFGEELPKVMKRAQAAEKKFQGRESQSDQSKRSKQ